MLKTSGKSFKLPIFPNNNVRIARTPLFGFIFFILLIFGAMIVIKLTGIPDADKKSEFALLADITPDSTRELPPLVFLGNENLPPLVFSNHGQCDGVAVDIVRALSARMSRTIEIRCMDWTAAQQMVAKGEADALIQINETDERKKIYDFSEPLLDDQFSIFVAKDRVGIADQHDLQGLRVGVEEAGLPTQILKTDPLILLHFVPSLKDGFELLQGGRIDAVVTNQWVGAYIVAENGMDRVRITGEPIATLQSKIAVKKGNAQLLADINQALQDIKSDGTYAHILNVWRPSEVIFETREQQTNKQLQLTLILVFALLVISLAWGLTLQAQVVRRKQAEKRITQERDNFFKIFSAAPVGFLLLNRESEITQANQAVADIILRDPVDIIGKRGGGGLQCINSFENPMGCGFDKSCSSCVLRNGVMSFLTEGQRIHGAEIELTLLINGKPQPRWLRVSAEPLELDGIQYVVAAIDDITERKQTEEALNESRRKMLTLLSNLDGAAYSCRNDPLWTMEFVSEGAFNLTGYTPDDLVGNKRISFVDIIHPQDLDEVRNDIEAALAKHERYQLTYRIICADGVTKWVWEQGCGIFTETGKFVSMEGFITDITKRKQVEEALFDSKERLAFVLEGSQLGYWDWDIETNQVQRNARWAEMLGYTLPEIELNVKQWTDLHHPDDRAAAWKSIQDHLEGRTQIHNIEYRMRTKDGQYKWILDCAKVVKRDAQGHPLRMSGTHTDITERKRAEEDLRLSEEKFSSAFRTSPDSVIIQRLTDGAYLDVNEGYTSLTGYTADDVLGRSSFEINIWANLDDRDKLIQGLRERGTITNFETQFRLKDGSLKTGLLSATTIMVNGEACSFSITRDITERKQIENTLFFLAQRGWAERSDDFFGALAQYLGETLAIDYIFIDQVYQNGKTAQTLANYWLGEIRPNFEYALKDTPCENIYGSKLCTYAEHIQKKFPRDFILTDMSAESYSGVPLWDSKGNPIGLIALLHRKPLKNIALIESLLQIVASHAGHEIERKQAEERIQNQIRRLNALHNIDNAIKSSVDLHATLSVFLNEVTAQLKVDAVSILLLNKHTLTLDHVASRGFHSTVLQHTRLGFGEGYAGRVIAERKTVHIADLAETENKLTQALSFADEKFAVYVGSPLIAKGDVVGVLEIFQRSSLVPDPEWFDFLDMLAGQAAIAIDSAQLFENLQRSNFDLALAYDATIEGWSHALDLRDKETEGHTRRVTEMAIRLARAMELSDEEIIQIKRGALLHDIGKMGIPDAILLKPDKLSDEEWIVMRKHPVYARDMLSRIEYLKPALDIPYCHHEKWDGTGYPQGLKGEQIPLAARLFAVVDVWDALSYDRPYRPGWSKERVIEHIRTQAGTHFDPKAVEIFLRLLNDN